MCFPSLSVWQPHQVGWRIYEEVQSTLNVFSISQCLTTTPSWLTYLWRSSEHITCVFHLSVPGNHIKLADVFMKRFRAYQMCFPSLSIWQPHQVGWRIYEEVQSTLHVFSISQWLATTSSLLTYIWRSSEHIKCVSIYQCLATTSNWLMYLWRSSEHIKCVFHLSVDCAANEIRFKSIIRWKDTC